MESSVKPRVNSICRACLSESENMRPLFEKMEGDDRTLFEVLSFVTNINVSANDSYPQQLCDTCFNLMCKTDEFKKTFMKSESVLKAMLKTGKMNDNGVKIEAGKSGLEPFQCTICFEKFMTCTSLESHVMFSHYCVKDSNKELENYNELTIAGVACDSSINKAYEVKEESDMVAGEGDYTEYFDVDTGYAETDYKQENDNKIFDCRICDVTLKDEKDFAMHIKNCNDSITRIPLRTKFKKSIKQAVKKNEACSKCNASFSSLKSLRRHQREVHKDETEEIYHCTTCLRSFLRKNSFLSHMKMHESKDHLKYICNTCKREFQHQAHLDNHVLAVHTRDKGYSCEICSISFTTLECLNIHKATHKVEKKHQCKLCNKAFQMMSTLNEHMRTHTGERPHLCSICGRGFTQKNNLEQHVRRHKGLKPFKCDTCERRFVSKGELVAHARKHSGAHPFVCDDCGKGFTTSSSLVKHRRIHTGERPYGCDLCSMRFSASGTLKNHRRTHTGEKPYQCSHCEKAFVQRQDLVSHIRCHTGERPYVCANCGQAFRKASALKTHVKIHGKDGHSSLTLSSLQDVNALLTHHVS